MAGILATPDILKIILNNISSENQLLKLFTNDITPTETTVVAAFTEASGGGYAAKALAGASWTFSTSNGIQTASYASQTWTFSGALSGSATVYGWYIVQDTSGKLIASQRLDDPVTPATANDIIIVVPRIQAISE